MPEAEVIDVRAPPAPETKKSGGGAGGKRKYEKGQPANEHPNWNIQARAIARTDFDLVKAAAEQRGIGQAQLIAEVMHLWCSDPNLLVYNALYAEWERNYQGNYSFPCRSCKNSLNLTPKFWKEYVWPRIARLTDQRLFPRFRCRNCASRTKK
ncbi:MAG: hypothetical protein KGJ23_08305 [Euryarchaeota archaeon]|nr:hypothetical protein [Euryarchaeota archaeon]MDE1836604.1 hypothetical protein [Euryarchaeota archaeon]MDE1879201.1 hypothetical protein [Euryarchaeota archaeon]MDE2044574.1 hypothetical protein [Thermoplasmata archaeon]